ncbi:tyrosine-protein kinase hopscotch-like [Scylla paramamosain]|uniref:tyrosine-protein kinase hopscotch-like n=1 Tax=Scylla paramamosain TaxID=85552 RepID=UPI003082DB44
MLTVAFYGEWLPLVLPQVSDQTVEDILVAAARVLGISPLCRHLFGLRNRSNGLWVSLGCAVEKLPANPTLEFRLRFKPYTLDRLKALDRSAFDYLFHQVRADFLAGEIPELIKHPEDGLGLVVTDVLLHLLNNPGRKVGDIDLKSFMPRELNGMANRLNVKRNAEKLVETCQNREASFVRERYLFKVEESQCSYGSEEYNVLRDEGGAVHSARLCIDPYHTEHPGLRYSHSPNKKASWSHLCCIEDLVFVTTRSQDLTVEVSRKTGVPCYFKLSTIEELEAMVGCLTGYYRLMCTWTFDLCRELSTPSLVFLRSNKCHGPIGSEVSARKLQEKGGSEVGVGLLRESPTEYDTFLLDVVVEANAPPHCYTIQRQGDKFHLQDSRDFYSSLGGMIRDFVRRSDSPLRLTRVLPFSDYDDTEQLLICASSSREMRRQDLSGPRVISMSHLTSIEDNISRGRYSDLIRAQWSGDKSREVAVKVPKLHSIEDTERYLAVLNQFAFVTCDCVVAVHGVTLSPLALVMEFLPLGPLDKYLQEHHTSLKEVDLVEAATHLARALWYLNVEDIHHNNIRCHNILVVEHTDQSFKVKLSDPGLVRYDHRDLHWIPREYHIQPPLALQDPTTDIWAFSTTLWQIFSLGATPLPGADMEEMRSLYATGLVLPRPDRCPRDLYQVMLRCWSPDPQARRQPQAVMRDVNQILYQVFNSRQKHAYQTIYSEDTDLQQQNGEVESSVKVAEEDTTSVTTQLTTLTYADGSVAQVTLNQLPDLMVDNLISFNTPEFQPPHIYEMGTAFSLPVSSQVRNVKPLDVLLQFSVSSPRLPPLPALPTKPLHLDKSDIKFGIKIGEGNYGEVYRGQMTDAQGRQETVAIKSLKAVGQTDDLKREFRIMQKLKHRNIVRLCGLVDSDEEDMYVVMEYLPMGSLKDYLKTHREHINNTMLLKFAMDIAEGMDYLEQSRIIHRDLAARNILVADQHTVKITDFGLAQEPNKGNYYIRQTNRALPLPWYAIECIETGKFSHKSDVWSYGVTCWEMFTRGQEPDLPQKPETLIQMLKNGKRLNLKPPCHPTIYAELIRPCWDQEPETRPNFSALIQQVKELQEEDL